MNESETPTSKHMTPQDQSKALAELDGWKLQEGNRAWPVELWIHPSDKVLKSSFELPNYLTSYDAIIPLIQKQPVDVIGSITWYIAQIRADYVFIPTPAQLCEALLRSTGKWKE